jgi:hypothetical protein
MSARVPDRPVDEEEPRPDEPFLARFHRRKLAARRQQSTLEPTTPEQRPAGSLQATTSKPEAPEPSDADMPPLETLTIDSDFTGFLSEKVSESLRRAALRKLFHSAEFNVVDGLDEYAEDFTTFEALGDIITSDMRHQLEVAAKKKAEAARQALLDEVEGVQETGAAPAPASLATANEAIAPRDEHDPRQEPAINTTDREHDQPTPDR